MLPGHRGSRIHGEPGFGKQIYANAARALSIKIFFSSSLSGEDGEIIPPIALKVTCRELIEDEDPQDPFSDRQLTDFW